MPDEDKTNDVQPQEPETVEEQPQAEPEEAAPAEEQPAEEETPQTEESSEDIDIDEYSRERYQQPQVNNTRSTVDDVAQELSQLPTDENGTVDANEAAKWFADRLDAVRAEAGQTAAQQATKAAMEVVSETAQQQQLLKKYPELAQDRDALDAVFDLRDAAALQGKGVTLAQAAARLNSLQQKSRKEGTQSATRRTVVQAAAHLETASTKGAPVGEDQQLAIQATQGVGDEAKAARHELLKRHIEKEMSEGRIQHP